METQKDEFSIHGLFQIKVYTPDTKKCMSKASPDFKRKKGEENCLPQPILQQLQRLYMSLIIPCGEGQFLPFSIREYFLEGESSVQFYCGQNTRKLLVGFGEDIAGSRNVTDQELIAGKMYLVDIRKEILCLINSPPQFVTIESNQFENTEKIPVSELYGVVMREDKRYWIDPRAMKSFDQTRLKNEIKRISQEFIDFA
jgi:hypothetical protein